MIHIESGIGIAVLLGVISILAGKRIFIRNHFYVFVFAFQA
jgi:hypothetical protein